MKVWLIVASEGDEANREVFGVAKSISAAMASVKDCYKDPRNPQPPPRWHETPRRLVADWGMTDRRYFDFYEYDLVE